MQNRKNYTLFGFKLKSELQEVYLTEFFRYLGLCMLELFIPIYIYQNHSLGIKAVFLFYGIYMASGMIFSLVTGEIASRLGLRIPMAIGIFMHIPLFISFAYLKQYEALIWVAAIINGMRLSFWFTSMNTDVTLQTSRSPKASTDIVNFKIIYAIILVISPVIGGYVISRLGYNYLYCFAISFSIISLVFSFLLGENFYKQDFPSLKILKKSLTDIKEKELSGIHLLYGIKGFVIYAIWPLLLYEIITDIESIGWLSTLTMLTLTILAVRISKSIDSQPHKTSQYIKRGIIVEGIAWLAQAGAFNFSTLFASDAARKISNEYVENSWLRLSFGNRNKQKEILNNMAQREITIYLGYVLCAILFIILSFFLSDILTLKIGIVAVGLGSIILGLKLKDIK